MKAIEEEKREQERSSRGERAAIRAAAAAASFSGSAPALNRSRRLPRDRETFSGWPLTGDKLPPSTARALVVRRPRVCRVAPSLSKAGRPWAPLPRLDFSFAGVVAGSLALAVSATALARGPRDGRRAEALRVSLAGPPSAARRGSRRRRWPTARRRRPADLGVHWRAARRGQPGARYLVGPAMKEQAERGEVSKGRAVALGAALAAGCVAAIGVL